MKHKIILLVVILSILQLCVVVLAQPTAFKYEVHSLASVQPVVPEPIDLQTVLMEDSQRDSKGGPYRFAVSRPVKVTTETDGTWEEIDEEILLWRLPIASPEALSLSLGFKRYFMPPGGKLFVYSSDESQVLGPYTENDNEEHGQLWTPLIHSDAVIVELTIPASEVTKLELELSSINHGYRNIDKQLLYRELGDSDWCHCNVACPEGDYRRDQIRSVARYHITREGDGAYWSTGALINNTAQDDKPYFLTAFHSFDKKPKDRFLTDIEKQFAATMVIYWNFEASTCEGTTGPENQTQTGAILRAAQPMIDFALVELDDMPSQAFGVYYAGWDRSNTAPTSGVAIHHPDGDLKKISIENHPLITVPLVDYNPYIEYGDYFEVSGWDVGATALGSSGCPLFDPNERIVGVLSNGASDCNNPGPDYFGPIYRAWTGDGTPDTRLSDWLDPCDTNVTFLDGKNQEYMTCDTIAIGVGTEPHISNTQDFPMSTEYHDNRTQVIYLAEEIGQSGSIEALALDITDIPGQRMNNWTIRMKHTTLDQYSTCLLTATGWTVVYQNNEFINNTGWKWFEFQTPFDYNETDNLMVDFSYNNTYSSSSGKCRWSSSAGQRSALAVSNSLDGDPLDWSEPGTCYEYIPNVKLKICGSWEDPCPDVLSFYHFVTGFESGFGGWVNVTDSDDIDWTRHSGSTTSNNTGPPSAADGTYYLYIESSIEGEGFPNRTAILESPCVNIPEYVPDFDDMYCGWEYSLVLRYHMHGAKMGDLIVEVSEDGGRSWDRFWSWSGDQGSGWQRVGLSLNRYYGKTIKLRFKGITGSGYTSDIAIDTISIVDWHVCEEIVEVVPF